MKLLEVWSSKKDADRVWVEHNDEDYPFVDLAGFLLLEHRKSVYQISCSGDYNQEKKDWDDMGFLICYLGPEGKLYSKETGEFYLNDN